MSDYDYDEFLIKSDVTKINNYFQLSNVPIKIFSTNRDCGYTLL